jgi:hypothetical protein
MQDKVVESVIYGVSSGHRSYITRLSEFLDYHQIKGISLFSFNSSPIKDIYAQNTCMFQQFLMAIWESLLQPAVLLLLLLYEATSTVLFKLKCHFHLAPKCPLIFSVGFVCNDKHIKQ